MPSEADVKFEIGHVLFIDIVGYSKLLIHEQSERLQRLREIARAKASAMVARSFFAIARKRRSPAPWR